tara:strand:+ start:151 stop:1545 length:1395 start_codon:yes stop_codon:yes gene_type:complete
MSIFKNLTNRFANIGAGGNFFQAPMEFPDDAARQKASREGFQNFANALGVVAAIQSGNPQRLALAQQNMMNFQERKKQQEDKRKAEENFNQMYATLNDDQKRIVDLQRVGINLPANNQTFERFSVYDLEGKPVGSVSKSNTQKIQEIENNPNYMLGPLSVDNLSETSTEGERARTRLLELNNKPELTDPEKSELNLLKTELYGEKNIVPFFDSSGNVLPQIITTWDMIEKPELINSLSKQGYVTTGTDPSGIFKAQTTIGDEISEKWENSTNTLNLINDLATVLDEGRNSPTIPGAIGNLINTGIYQFKAAENLLTNYQQQFPKEYSETINYIQNKHGSVLDKISADRGIATSVVMKLAYSLAKQNDPGGRLSDRDIETAIIIIGGSGANVDARLATLNSLSKGITKEYNTYIEATKRRYKGNNIIEQDIKNFSDLPVFYKSTFNPGPEKTNQVGKYEIEVIPQ